MLQCRTFIGSHSLLRPYLAVAFAAALSLAACGDDDGGGSPTADAAQPAIDAPQAADAAPADASPADASPPDAEVPDAAAAPYAYDLFLQGGFNDPPFSAGDEPEFTFAYDGDLTYSLTVTLTAETHEFKVSDDSLSNGNTWSVNMAQKAAIELDTPTTLVLAVGPNNNTELTIDTAGAYTFDVDATDPDAPILTISAAGTGVR
ncbi:MAG: hypothetical protein Tsb0020_48080 [Haliangiales bacterium]